MVQVQINKKNMKKIIRLTESDLFNIVKKVLNEQSKRKLHTDLSVGDILNVVDKQGGESEMKVLQLLPPSEGGFYGKLANGPKELFVFGPEENQIKHPDTEIGGYLYTISSVMIGGKPFPVDKGGNF